VKLIVLPVIRITGVPAWLATASTGEAGETPGTVILAVSPDRRRTPATTVIITVAMMMAQTVAVPVEMGPRFTSSHWAPSYI